MLETLVALAILALATTVLTVGWSSRRGMGASHRFESELFSLLRQAQREARIAQRPTLVRFGQREIVAELPSRSMTAAIPPDIALRLISAAEMSSSAATVVFLPDGRSSGAEIAITSPLRTTRVAIGWASGRAFAHE